jgi:hypothetical protein
MLASAVGEWRRGPCQSKFYTACLRLRARQSSTVFAHESPTRSAGFGAENGVLWVKFCKRRSFGLEKTHVLDDEKVSGDFAI